MYIPTDQKNIDFIREFLKKKGKKYNALKGLYDNKTLLNYKDDVCLFYHIILSDLNLAEGDFSLRGFRNWMAIEIKRIEANNQNTHRDLNVTDYSEKMMPSNTNVKFKLTEKPTISNNKKLLSKPQKVKTNG